jgi:ketosteroid isomerase-like protein
VEAAAIDPRVERLFEAVNERDLETVIELCHPDVEFHSITARLAERDEPYRGHDGMRSYFADVEENWDELRISASDLYGRPESGWLVLGRVVARSKQRGLRDLPAAWVWQLKDGLFWRGRVYEDPQEAARALAG